MPGDAYGVYLDLGAAAFFEAAKQKYEPVAGTLRAANDWVRTGASSSSSSRVWMEKGR